MRVHAGALGEESERELIVEEANDSVRIGEGWERKQLQKHRKKRGRCCSEELES